MKKEIGITLIALVITVIVLLILAGVTISTLTGDNGLLTKANEAKIVTEESKLEEEVQLAFLEYEADKHTKSQENLENNLKSIFEKMYGTGNITLSKSGKNYKVKIKNSKTTYRIRHDGTIKKYEEMDPTNVYAKIEGNTLKLRATQPDDNYKEYLNSSSIESNLSGTKESIEYIEIEEPIAPTTTEKMFDYLSYLKEIRKIENLHTENSTSMMRMFCHCESLETLDISNFDTGKVTNMNKMFGYLENITKLDISSFNTDNVVIMNSMFYTLKLTQIDVSGFNTDSVTDMSSMFSGCSLLKELDLSNFNTSNVKNMSSMFNECSSLTKLDLSNFDTRKVTNMYLMFGNCKSLTKLDLNNFNTDKVTDMSYMFRGCKLLSLLNINVFCTDNVINMHSMFNGCSSLTTLDLSNFNTLGVTSYIHMLLGVTAKITTGNNWNSEMTAQSTAYSGTQWNT